MTIRPSFVSSRAMSKKTFAGFAQIYRIPFACCILQLCLVGDGGVWRYVLAFHQILPSVPPETAEAPDTAPPEEDCVKNFVRPRLALLHEGNDDTSLPVFVLVRGDQEASRGHPNSVLVQLPARFIRIDFLPQEVILTGVSYTTMNYYVLYYTIIYYKFHYNMI